jgi:hypothetical protein
MSWCHASHSAAEMKCHVVSGVMFSMFSCGCATREVTVTWSHLKIPGLQLELQTKEDLVMELGFDESGMGAGRFGTHEMSTFPGFRWRLDGRELICCGADGTVVCRLEVVAKRGNLLKVRSGAKSSMVFKMWYARRLLPKASSQLAPRLPTGR